MNDERKGRIIRGGTMTVGALGLVGTTTGMVGYAMGQPDVMWGGAMILITAALIGAGCVVGVQFPARHPRRRRRHRE